MMLRSLRASASSALKGAVRPRRGPGEGRGAGGRDGFRERVGGDAERSRLVAEERVVEADHVADAEMVRGGDADGLGAPDHLHPPQYLQVAAVGGQGLEAGLVDEDDEGRAA